jgi:RNA polymerase sigma-70 factor, ECF subfamily
VDCESVMIERCTSGDMKAFEELVGLHEKSVYGLVRRYFSVDDSYDVAQDVFVKVFRSLGSFGGKSSLKTWIFRIAINTCYDELKKRKARESEMAYDCGEAIVKTGDMTNDPQVQLDRKELFRELGEAVSSLPIDSRHIFILREIEGFTYGEISCILDIPINTVKSRLYRARESLRNRLREGGVRL